MENQDTKTKENSTWSKQSEDDQKEGRCRKGDGKDFRNMSNERVKIQPAVKKETEKVAAGTAIGVILMWVVFGILHVAMPEKVPFDYCDPGWIMRWYCGSTELFYHGDYRSENRVPGESGRCPESDAFQLLQENVFAAGMVYCSHYNTIFSVCSRTSSSAFSRSSH